MKEMFFLVLLAILFINIRGEEKGVGFCPVSCTSNDPNDKKQTCEQDVDCVANEKCCPDDCYPNIKYCKLGNISVTPQPKPADAFCPVSCTASDDNDKQQKCEDDLECLENEKCCPDNCYPNIKFCKIFIKEFSEITTTEEYNKTNKLEDAFCPVSCTSTDENVIKQKCEGDNECSGEEKCCPDNCYPNIKFCKVKVES